MGFLSEWGFRKSKNVVGTTFGAQTNYTLQLTIFKSTGTDTNTEVYLNNNCNDDFSDIRFTSLDGLTLLEYFIEGFTSGVSALVSIKVDIIPVSPGSSIMYIYYGNVSAVSISNGNNTYLFFDIFDNPILDTNKWEILQGTVDIVSGHMIVNNPDGIVTTKNAIQINCEINYNIFEPDIAVEATIRDIRLTKETTVRNFSRYSHSNAPLNRSTLEGVSQLFTQSGNGPFKHTIRHTFGGNWMFLRNDVLIQTQTSLRAAGNVFFLHFATGIGDNTDVKYVRVRKFASPEPAFGSTGAEETPQVSKKTVILGKLGITKKGAFINKVSGKGASFT